MSGDFKCAFCHTELKLAAYVNHIRRDCEALSLAERNRAQDAVKKLLCECRVCNHYVYVNGYEHHREERHPHTSEVGKIVEPQLACFCPFVPGTVISGDIPFSEYRRHALGECVGYVNFIAAHCRPPVDWPHAEIEKLKYWLRLLEVRRQSRAAPEDSELEQSAIEHSGPSIWIRFVPGGLCNGR